MVSLGPGCLGLKGRSTADITVFPSSTSLPSNTGGPTNGHRPPKWYQDIPNETPSLLPAMPVTHGEVCLGPWTLVLLLGSVLATVGKSTCHSQSQGMRNPSSMGKGHAVWSTHRGKGGSRACGQVCPHPLKAHVEPVVSAVELAPIPCMPVPLQSSHRDRVFSITTWT